MGIEEWILLAVILVPALVILLDDGNLERGSKK